MLVVLLLMLLILVLVALVSVMFFIMMFVMLVFLRIVLLLFVALMLVFILLLVVVFVFLLILGLLWSRSLRHGLLLRGGRLSGLGLVFNHDRVGDGDWVRLRHDNGLSLLLSRVRVFCLSAL